jgi:ABC-2 type transport system permease protein
MILANFRMTFRNRMALFWNLAFPAIFIFLFGFLFQGDFSLTVGVAGADSSPVAAWIVQEMEATEGFDLNIGSEEDELAALQDSDRAAVVVFSPGENPDQIQAAVYYDETNPQQGQIALAAVQQFLQQVNTSALGSERPVEITSQAVASTGLRYIDFLVPGILAMSIMNSGMIGLASAFVSYREKGILRRIRATPFPLSSFITARIISQVGISVVQAVVLIGLGRLLFGLQINGSLLNVLVMVVIGSLAFLSLGFVISSFAKNQEAADALANAVSFPMLFLAGVFFPVDAAPRWLQPITRILPLRYLADAMRGVMVQGSSLASEWQNILVLLITATIGVLLSVRFFRWDSASA